MSTSHRTRMEHARNIMEQYFITYVSRCDNDKKKPEDDEEESDSMGPSDRDDDDDVHGILLGPDDGEDENEGSEEGEMTEPWRCPRLYDDEEYDDEEYDGEEDDGEEDDDA